MAALSNSASQPIAATNRAMRCSGNMDGVVGASQPGDSPRSSAPQDFERCSDLREWLSSHGGQRRRRKSDDAYEARLAQWLDKARCRRDKSCGNKPSAKQLTLAQKLHLDNLMALEGVVGDAEGGSASGADLTRYCSSGVDQGQVRKRLRIKDKPVALNESADVARGSGVSRPTVATKGPIRSESVVATTCGGNVAMGCVVSQPISAVQIPYGSRQRSTERGAPRRTRSASRPTGDTIINDDQKKILLQLRRLHYDAIKDRRKKWEARPLFDDEAKGGRRNWIDKSATVGREVILQSGAGTNDRVRIAEVRRYAPDSKSPYPLHNMVAELDAELLPDVADMRARVRVYEDLYGHLRCAKGFVAMRLEWPGDRK